MGPYLSLPIKDKHTTSGQSADNKYVWAASEMQGWRNSMEDSHITRTDIDENKTCIFGVFDGHGGKEVAKFVQKHFVQEFLRNPKYKSGDIKTALEETFLLMDVMIDKPEGKKELSEIKNGPERSDTEFQCYAGCTANVAVIYKGKLYVANAGDSRTVLSQNGQQYAMSEDHKPDNPLEKKRITDGGGFIAEGRVNGNLNLSRAIGDMQYQHDKSRDAKEQNIISFPDVQEIGITDDIEFILMGCDGIWECLTNQQLIDFIAKKKAAKQSESQIIESLLDNIIAPDTATGIGCDNMTTILITVNKN